MSFSRSEEGTHPCLARFNGRHGTWASVEERYKLFPIYREVVQATLEINQQALAIPAKAFNDPLGYLSGQVTHRGLDFVLDLLNYTIENRLYGDKLDENGEKLDQGRYNTNKAKYNNNENNENRRRQGSRAEYEEDEDEDKSDKAKRRQKRIEEKKHKKKDTDLRPGVSKDLGPGNNQKKDTNWKPEQKKATLP